MRGIRANLGVTAATLTVAAAVASLPTVAYAGHWAMFGTDAGRSGTLVDQAGVEPLTLQFQIADREVRTQLLISGASTLSSRRFAYGNENGRLHLRRLTDGAEIGPAGGIQLSTDADAFSGSGGSVGFASSSEHDLPGQIFAVVNRDGPGAEGDLSLAQVDEQSGNLVRLETLPGTDGFTISSSPLVTEAGSDRELFFLASSSVEVRLFRLPIANATSEAATLGTIDSRAIAGGNALSSPAVARLNDSAGKLGSWVVVAAADSVRSYSPDLSAEGPSSPALGGTTQTPSATGETPARIFVATDTGGSTVAHQLTQGGAAQTLTVAASTGSLAGSPAPALAVDRQSEGWKLAYVTTSTAIHEVATELSLGGPVMFVRGSRAGAFSHVTAAIGRGAPYVATDGGALGAGYGGTPLSPSENAGATYSYSQPALSHSFVIYASDRGVFVYTTTCGNAVTGTTAAETLTGTTAGDAVQGRGGADRLEGLSAGDCVLVYPPDGAPAARSVLSGGSGADRLDGERIDGSGGPGNDEINGEMARDRLSGDQGDDRLTGGPLEPLAARDSDVLDGGLGNDTLAGSLYGDSLNGGPDADGIYGQSGDDGITGASGNDRLYGGLGDDRIEGGLGSDRIYGERGNDNIVSIDGQADSVSCGDGRDVVRADGGDRISRDCETVIKRAGSFDKEIGAAEPPPDLSFAGGLPFVAADGSPRQTLTGTGIGDTIDASGADDRLLGLGGDDVLAGGGGTQRLEGAGGSDVLSGGPGDDTLLGGEERDYMEGGPGDDTLEGDDGSNLMNGSVGNDVLRGGPLVDSLNGGSDEDQIYGEAGNDGITGASGNDRLFGGDGADRIEGGLGADLISGDAGGDSIVAADGMIDTIRCGDGRDVVRADGEDRIADDCELVIARQGNSYVVVSR